jgi:hypothetical protein
MCASPWAEQRRQQQQQRLWEKIDESRAEAIRGSRHAARFPAIVCGGNLENL